VDDEKSVGKSIGRLLEMEEIDYTYVDNAASAMEAIQASAMVFSLIISDQRMPGTSGTDFLQQARTVTPDSIRFLLTAHSDMDTIIDSVNKGSVHRYINKPWDNDELIKVIRSAFAQFELILEDERLLEIAKRQNKKLFKLDRELMSAVKQHEETIVELDKTLAQLQKQIDTQPETQEYGRQQILEQMAPVFMGQDKLDAEKLNQFYWSIVKTMAAEFDELANRNGFEMPEL
jgi:response regulator RpfG family c-di-GMP phosphodiesterase